MNVWEMALLARSEIKSDVKVTDAELVAYAERRREVVDCVGPEEARRLLVLACDAPRLTDAERADLIAAFEKERERVNAEYAEGRPAPIQNVGWRPHETKVFGQSVVIGLRLRYEATREGRFAFAKEQVQAALKVAVADAGRTHLLHCSPENKESIYDAAIAILVGAHAEATA